LHIFGECLMPTGDGWMATAEFEVKQHTT